jgi:EAL domain-containing protein (putative c-di-GMP-specific phosphodiesterase class I)
MPTLDEKKGYVTVPIHQAFYYNTDLELPTVVREYKQLEKNLDDLGYLACITIQVENLNRIEYQYGSTIYHQLLGKIAKIISTLKEKDFRKEDVFVIDLFDVDTFVLFLSAPRKSCTMLLDHLETLVERVRVRIANEVFQTLYPYFKVYSKPAIGYALVIRNPMITNMRLIMRVVTEAKKMGEFLSERQSYVSKYMLQKMIIEGNVDTVFQPIVQLDTLEITGYEALSRGPEDTEFASPLLMFMLAAEYGLSYELDVLCRRNAFENIRRAKTDKKIFVNTLTMTVHDPEFRGAYLKELLEDLKIKPENVVFELNEKLAIDNYDLFRTAMKDYLDIGIVHASDDIGAGNSDLERIMELSPGFLKIDLGLVRDIDKSHMKQEIIKAMVSLAQGIGSLIVAEGVETKGEYRKLKELGVTYGQGYLFAKPAAKLSETVDVRVEDLEAAEEVEEIVSGSAVPKH